MTLGSMFRFLVPALIIALSGCATNSVTGSCPVDQALLMDISLPAHPTGPATNSDLLDYALDLNEQVKLDSARKAELRKQLAKCQ